MTSKRLLRSSISALSLAITTLALFACGDEIEPQTPGARSGCTIGEIEADLDVAPWAGPNVDSATGTFTPPSGSYVISATYGAPKQDAAAQERWGQLFTEIEADLMTRQGLLALRLGSSDACGSGRTLAAWSSEEAMYDFVTGPAHLKAMGAANEILQHFAGTHWDANGSAQPTFEEAARHLAQDQY